MLYCTRWSLTLFGEPGRVSGRLSMRILNRRLTPLGSPLIVSILTAYSIIGSDSRFGLVGLAERLT